MTIETNRDQASTLLRVALEDNELGNWRDALEAAQDAVNFLADIAEEKELMRASAWDGVFRGMSTEDIEALLATGGVK